MHNQCVHQKKQLCVGCGVCAGICDAIQMKSDSFGFYYPDINTEKCVHCGKCVSVCPMLLGDEKRMKLEKECWKNEEISYRMETGYYRGAYEGEIARYRPTSASGGFCTALLIELLKRSLVQSIYCAKQENDIERFFVSERITTSEELQKSSGSAYYPIEISQTLRSIRQNDEKTAIVCLPCQATAIRLAMQKDKRLRDRIVFIIGLVCGGIPGKSMVEYIASDLNIDKQQITRITFREKDKGIRCNNCQIKFYCGENEIAVSRFHGESFGFVYLNHILHNRGCDTCTDIFAEQADAVFGDAWFDENKPNEMGTSICITRNSVLDQIMKDIGAEVSNIDRMILAQSNVGLINRKKRLSYYYKKYYKQHGYVIDTDDEKTPNKKTYIRVFLNETLADRNRKSWLLYKENRISFNQLKKKWRQNILLKKKAKL